MSQFEKFKDEFNNLGKEIYHFIYNLENGENPLDLELIENNDEIERDSYGNEDSRLERVYYSKKYDIYIMFSGTRQSYSGEDWDDFKEVKKVTKTIEVYE